jgi:hypothetical protein
MIEVSSIETWSVLPQADDLELLPYPPLPWPIITISNRRISLVVIAGRRHNWNVN